MKVEKRPTLKRFVCDTCGKVFATLREHMEHYRSLHTLTHSLETAGPVTPPLERLS